MLKNSVLFFALLLFPTGLPAQSDLQDSIDLYTEEIPEITLDTDNRLLRFVKFNEKQLEKFIDAKDRVKAAMKELDKAKKNRSRKKQKGVWFGKKTEKAVIKTKRGRRTIVEKFTYIKKYERPPIYTGDIFYFVKDKKKKKLVKTENRKLRDAYLLHGHYIKTMSGQTLEEGYFFKGVKHGRWEKFSTDYTRIDKRTYIKGFGEETEFLYFDEKKKRIKSITSFHKGYKDGIYLSFFETGRPKVTGQHEEGFEVGKWMEYRDTQRFPRYRQTYRRTPGRPFKPRTTKVLRQWDKKGKLFRNR